MENTGRYKTKQREIILGLLKDNYKRHMTADEVVLYLQEQNTPVGKATVYRYLDCLVEQGIIRKYAAPEGKGSCYQYVVEHAECNTHYHFKCEKCNKLFHVECKYLDGIAEHVYNDHQFRINNSRTIYYGICRDCAE